MLEELVFTGELKKEKCSICKLRLKQSDEILQCPQCESLFHKEHLVRWLKEIPECPVCENNFSDLVKKYKDELFVEEDDPIFTEEEEPERYIFLNQNPLQGRIVLRIVTVIFGLVFAHLAHFFIS